jgi:hypothetical protein
LTGGWRKLHSGGGRSTVLVAVRFNLIFWDVTPCSTEQDYPIPNSRISLLKRLLSYIMSFIICILQLVILRVTSKENEIGGGPT